MPLAPPPTPCARPPHGSPPPSAGTPPTPGGTPPPSATFCWPTPPRRWSRPPPTCSPRRRVRPAMTAHAPLPAGSAAWPPPRPATAPARTPSIRRSADVHAHSDRVGACPRCATLDPDSPELAVRALRVLGEAEDDPLAADAFADAGVDLLAVPPDRPDHPWRPPGRGAAHERSGAPPRLGAPIQSASLHVST